MSCRLLETSKISQLEKIKIFLNNQGYISVEDGDDKTDESYQGWSSWLSDCLTAISPTNELFVLAKDQRAVFLSTKNTAKFEDDAPQLNEICWQGEISSDQHECVTSLLCVPLASQQRSSYGWPDWSCIIAGFTSGFIKIYMQNGGLLISQFLHDSPVVHMDLRTKFPLISSSGDQIEELSILYSNAVVIIDGFSLYQSLRACRSQLAKAHASNFQEAVQPPSLAYRKWRLDGQEQIFDIVNCGMVNPCLFDRLAMSSFQVEMPMKLKVSASGSRRIISSGRNPFIGWYELHEESSSPLISDVALTVASKLTTAVMSKISSATGDWLGFGGSLYSPRKDASPPKHIELGTSVRLRYGLPDKRRRAESIVLSPNDSLAACTDDFGRILVISSDSGMVVRMLKGYRDAQCGWLLVEEQLDENHEKSEPRQALFLVVYAPRRGILEIWLAEQGPRVSAFSVGKDCRLVYNRHGTLGNSSKNMKDSYKDFHQCFLVDNAGKTNTINVPFHCSLSTSNSVKMRDGCLLKKITSILERKTNFGPDGAGLEQFVSSITSLFREVEAPTSHFKVIVDILHCEKLSAVGLESCLLAISDVLDSKVNAMEEDVDVEHKSEINLVQSFCLKQIDLVKLFCLLKELHEDNIRTETSMEIDEDPKEIIDLLGLSEAETSKLHEAFEKLRSLPGQTKTENQLSVSRFLQAFSPIVNEPSSERGSLQLPSTNRPDLLHDIPSSENLACFIFKPLISQKIPVSELDFLLNSKHIFPETLMELLAIYSQANATFSDISSSTVMYIHALALAFFDAQGKKEPDFAAGLSNWWKPVRDVLEISRHLNQSLIMALLCRSIPASSCSQAKHDDGDGISESVKENRKEWNICIQRLTDLTSLEDFLRIGHFNDAESPPASSCCEKLSIKGILNSEAGSITQIVATHLVQRRVPGPCIRDLNINSMEKGTKSNEDGTENWNNDLLEAIKKLQKRFPNSLETDTLLAHCCWECNILWKSDIEEKSNLFSAVLHLSCISNPLLKQGLAFMFWKAVYRESIKSIYNLIEKVGKCPKDRLFRKHTGMSITAVEKYLLTAQNLIQLLRELDFSDAKSTSSEEEPVWQNCKRSGLSIIENAMDEPSCEPHCIGAVWSVLVTLRSIVLTAMKSIRPSELFESRSTGNLLQSFPTTTKVVKNVSDSMVVSRKKFSASVLSLLVTKYSNSDEAESGDDAVMSAANDIFQLSKYFGLPEDELWRHFSCQLFLAGLDRAGNEAALSVHDKTTLVQPLLHVAGSRLAYLLLESADSETLSAMVSSLPTHITSWMQNQSVENVSARNDDVIRNIRLLQQILSFTKESSRNKKFITDLIENLELFPRS